MNNKSIFIGITLAAVVAMLVTAHSGILQDADASLRDNAKDRANNNLDKHIAAGGAHGEKAQKIKDRLNGGSDDSCPTCD